jgi:hypothetical protein
MKEQLKEDSTEVRHERSTKGNRHIPKLPIITVVVAVVLILWLILNNSSSVNNNQSTTILPAKAYTSNFTILSSGTTFSITMPKNYYAYKFETPPNSADIYINNGSVEFTNDSEVFIQNQTQYLNFIQNNNLIGSGTEQGYSTWYTNFDSGGHGAQGIVSIGSSDLAPNQTYYILFMNAYADGVGYPASTTAHYRNLTGIYSNATIIQAVRLSYVTCPSGYTILVSNLYCKPNNT